MTKNKQHDQFNIVILLVVLSLVIMTGCTGNAVSPEPKNTPPAQVANYATTTPVQVAATPTVVTTLTSTPSPPTATVPLVPTSTLPTAPDTQGSQSPNLDQFIPTECMEGQSKEFVISTDERMPTYLVEEQRVILPLRICRNSYDDRSDFNWLFKIQVNAITSADGKSLDKLPNMYIRYRQYPDDDNRYIRGKEDAVYSFEFNDRTNKYYALSAGDRGIYDLVIEFEDMDGFDSLPRTIDISVAVETWYI